MAVVIASAACTVDDYQDANPLRPKDGPAGFLKTPGGEAIVDTETNGDKFTYIPINKTSIFRADMVDVPGLIDSVGVRLAANKGSVTSIGLDAKGSATGLVTVTYTAPGTATTEDVTINIFDAQQPRKSVSLVPSRVKVINTNCFASRPLVGFYKTVTSGFDSETGTNYSNLEAEVEFRINAGGVNHPGRYRLTDGSFGLYPLQGFANNFINVVFCGNNVLDADEEFAGKFTGTLNIDGTISITWSNTFGDTGTTLMTPK